MPRILTILEEFVNEIEKDNPYKLVIKGVQHYPCFI